MMALTKFCDTNILAHTLRDLNSVVVSFMDYGNAAVAKLIGNAAKSCRCADGTFEQNRSNIPQHSTIPRVPNFDHLDISR